VPVIMHEPFAWGGGLTTFRHITVRLIEQEVPLHYLLNFRARRFVEAVENGVADARAWCRAEGLL
jgi:hypothetical protein